jgi:hypothetical protein
VRTQRIENAAIVGSVGCAVSKKAGVPFCARPASRLQCSFGDTLRPRQGIGQARSVPISLRICEISRTRGAQRATRSRSWGVPPLDGGDGSHHEEVTPRDGVEGREPGEDAPLVAAWGSTAGWSTPRRWRSTLAGLEGRLESSAIVEPAGDQRRILAGVRTSGPSSANPPFAGPESAKRHPVPPRIAATKAREPDRPGTFSGFERGGQESQHGVVGRPPGD